MSRLVLLICCLAVAGCGAATAASDPHSQGAVSGPGLQGLILKPEKAAPPLVLHNYTGPQSVSLRRFRGKAVLVTFVYTHCPDVCPVIVSKLAAAQRMLGAKAHHLQILAVTVDPRHDTPRAIRLFLGVRDALGRMDYLLGSVAQLRRIYRAWGVGVVFGHDARITHSALVFGITASGRMADVYSSSFSPAQIVHDVPLLARS